MICVSSAAIGPYSQAIVAGGLVVTSGQIPINPATKTVPEGITAQTEQVMQNIKAILDEAGYTFQDVVKSTCLLADMEYFKPMNEVYAKYYSTDCPARAAFAVKGLPMDLQHFLPHLHRSHGAYGVGIAMDEEHGSMRLGISITSLIFENVIRVFLPI